MRFISWKTRRLLLLCNNELMPRRGARFSTFEGLGMHLQNKSGCVHTPVFRRDEVPRHSSRAFSLSEAQGSMLKLDGTIPREQWHGAPRDVDLL